MNERIFNSSSIRSTYRCRYIISRYRSSIDRTVPIPLRKLFVFTKTFIRLLTELLFHRPNLIYFQFSPLNGPFYRDALLGLIARCFSVRVIYHIRVYGIRKNSGNRFNRWVYKTVFKKNFIACHSENMFHDFRGVFSGKLLILTNGMEDQFKNHNFQAKDDSGPPRFLFISNYLFFKGIPTLIKAAAILKEKNLKFILNLIGDYTHDYTPENLQKEIVEHGISDEVKILGPVYGERKKRYMLQADVFVFPTEYEAFGNVAIEAMQAGLPVIASHEGSLPLMIDEGVTGFLIPKGNPKALAKKMEYLISNRNLCYEMGLAGRRKYLDYYTLEKFEARFVKAVRDVCTEAS